MKKRLPIIILGIVFIMAMSSCGKSEPTVSDSTLEPTATIEPTPEPTVEPTVEPTPEPTEEPTPEPTVEPTEEPTPEPDFVVEPIEPKTLYATQKVNLRQGPSADDFAKIGSLSPRQQVTVVGEVREYKGKSVYWWQLDTGEFVSAAYLSEKPIPESSPGTGGSSTTEQVPQNPAPGTVMPGGIIWEGGGGELSDLGGAYSDVDVQ